MQSLTPREKDSKGQGGKVCRAFDQFKALTKSKGPAERIRVNRLVMRRLESSGSHFWGNIKET